MSPASMTRLEAGRQAIADLRRYQARITLDQFLADHDQQRMVLHALLIASQACIDCAISACRDRNLATTTYRGAFEALGQAQAIPAPWVPQLLAWASLRNILSHFYPIVDMSKVHASLNDVGVLSEFLDWYAGDPTG